MTDDDLQTLSATLLSSCVQRANEQAIIFRDGSYTFGQLRSLIAACALHFEGHGVECGSILQVETADPALAILAAVAARVLGAEVLVSETGYDLCRPSCASHAFTASATANDGFARLIPITAEGLSPATYTLAAQNKILSRATAAQADSPWLRLLPAINQEPDSPLITVSDAELLARAKPIISDLHIRGGRLAVVHSSMMSYSALLRLLSALAGGGAIVEPGSWHFWHEAKLSTVSVDLQNVPNLLRASDLTRKLPFVELSGDAVSNGAISELSERFARLRCTFETAKDGAIWCASLPSGTAISAPFGRLVDPTSNLAVTPTESQRTAGPGVLRRGTEDGDLLANPPLIALEAAGTGGIRLLGRMWGELLERDGRSLDPSQIDGVLRSVDGIVDAVAFRTPKTNIDEIIAFTVFDESTEREVIVDRVRALCLEQLGAAFVPDKLRPIRAIPRQQNGMPDRSACAELILSALEERSSG